MSLLSPSDSITAARAGAIASVRTKPTLSGFAAAALNAGTVVRMTTTEGKYAAPASAADVARLAGAIAYSPLEPLASTGEDFEIAAIFPIVDNGEIWLKTEEALTVGSNPFVRFATGTNGAVKGVLRTDADTTEAAATAAQCPGIEVLAVLGTTLAKCKINLPQ